MEGNAMCLQTFDTEAAAKQFEIITTRKNNLHNIGSDIACLEYSIHVSIIFIENFMNKNERITRENIHAKENLMRESLEYFSSWKRYIMNMGVAKENEKKFLSTTTFNNLRLMIAGFFKYCHIIFETDDPPNFVCFLHSNQSSLEASFSRTRAAGADNPRSYGNTNMLRQVTNSIRYLKNNPMYKDTADIDEQNISTSSGIERVLGRSIDYRNAKMEEIVGRVATDNDEAANNNQSIQVCIETAINHISNALSQCIINKRLDCHFALYIMKNEESSERLNQAVYTSIGTKYQQWFEYFFSANLIHLLFDLYCRTLISRIFICFNTSLETKSKSRAERSVWYNIMQYANSNRFTTDMNILPIQLQMHTPCFLLLQLLVSIFEMWANECNTTERQKSNGVQVHHASEEEQHESLSDDESEEDESNLSDEIINEVQRCFGYGIHAVIKEHKKRPENVTTIYLMKNITFFYECVFYMTMR